MPDCCQVSGQIDLGTPSPLINKNEGVNKKTKKKQKVHVLEDRDSARY